jgi:hypothetical protein
MKSKMSGECKDGTCGNVECEACQFYQDEGAQIAKIMKLFQTNPTNVELFHAAGIILHNGKPPGLHKCSRCWCRKDSSHFGYYSCRVDKNGYLMRSNALCFDCRKVTNKERKDTLDKAKKAGKIPPKPKPGDICSNCVRPWGTPENPRNWHRDHDAIRNEFRRWLCGDCNMALHDHRHGKS